MSQPNEFINAYSKLAIKTYDATKERSNKDLIGMDKIDKLSKANEMSSLYIKYASSIINKVGVKKYNEVALQTYSVDARHSALYAYLSERRAAIYRYVEENHIELSKEDKKYVDHSVSNDDVPKYVEMDQKYAEIADRIGLKGNYLDDFNNAIMKPNNSFILNDFKVVATPIMQIATTEQLDEFTKQANEVKEFDEMDPKEYTIPVGNKNIDNLLEDENTPKNVKEALEYVKEHIRYASASDSKTKEYSNYLFDRNQEMMSEITKTTRRTAKEFEEQNPEFKDLFTPTMTGAFQVTPGKEDFYQALMSQKYKISDETKEAMRTIMHKIDEMDIITMDNVNQGEEGSPKRYAMAKVGRVMTLLNLAIEKGDMENIPKLVEEYKKEKETADELLQIANEKFSHGNLLYGANVDVARTDFMPIEYRKDCTGVSQVSELMNFVKLCKMNNLPIDTFVEDPKKYLQQFRNQLYDKYDVNKLSEGKGKGAMLFLMENKPCSLDANVDVRTLTLIMRGQEGMKGFDPTNTVYNTGMQEAQQQVGFANFASFMSINYLTDNVDKTVRNILIFDGKKSQEYTADPTKKYDFNEMKAYGTLDADKYIKDNDINLTEMAQKIRGVFIDYARARASVGLPPSKKVVNGLKSMATKIAELKPELVNTNGFKELTKVTNSVTTQLTAQQYSVLAGTRETPVTMGVKYASLVTLTEQKNDYKKMSGWTKFVGWLPFVWNKATQLRHDINNTTKFLKDHGVSDKAINTEYTEKRVEEKRENGAMKFENVPYNFKYGQPEDIQIYDVSKPKSALNQQILGDLNKDEPKKEVIVNEEVKEDVKEVEIEQKEIK